jgi:uncharacterized membrane protein
MDHNRIFGGNPWGVALRLAVLSVIVGIVLSALDIRPQEILGSLRLLVLRIYNLGFGAFESVLGYMLLGAVVVIPVWLLARLLSGLSRRNDDRPS